MPFTLTCKCPSCDRITSQCTDTSLSKDRTEFDGVRCHKCIKADKPKPLNLHGKPFYFLSNKQKMARNTNRMFWGR